MAYTDESRFYLASYDVTAEMLTASLQTISQTAKRIISVIDGDGKRTEYEDGNVSTFADSHISDGFRVDGGLARQESAPRSNLEP